MSGRLPGEFDAPLSAANGQFVNGVFQALIPGVPYRRYIRSIQVFCSEPTSVTIYVDAITPAAQIAQNNNGSNNTWGPVNIQPIMYNSVIIVVWPDADVNANGFAVIQAGGVIGG